jgi:hypothetical protein
MPTTNLGDATTQVVVLAFDLVGQQAANLPTLLENSLSAKPVKDAIQSALESFALKQSAAIATNTLTAKDAQDLMTAILSAAGGKAGDAALQQIKDSPAYKLLDKAIQDFQTAAKSSPMGVWIDSNKGVVYVTGIALVIGGVVALYATKTGGGVVNLAAGAIKNKPFQVYKVGKFTLQAQMLQFQPDKGVLGAGLIATEKWKQLSVSVSLGVVASTTQMQQVQGQMVVKTGGVTITGSATDTLPTKKIDLHLSVGLDQNRITFGLGAIDTAGKITGGSVDAKVKTGAGDFGLKASDDNKNITGLATWTLHF